MSGLGLLFGFFSFLSLLDESMNDTKDFCSQLFHTVGSKGEHLSLTRTKRRTKRIKRKKREKIKGDRGGNEEKIGWVCLLFCSLLEEPKAFCSQLFHTLGRERKHLSLKRRSRKKNIERECDGYGRKTVWFWLDD